MFVFPAVRVGCRYSKLAYWVDEDEWVKNPSAVVDKLLVSAEHYVP